jgi:hypothetical protein
LRLRRRDIEKPCVGCADGGAGSGGENVEPMVAQVAQAAT